jgi:hypothetical protein
MYTMRIEVDDLAPFKDLFREVVREELKTLTAGKAASADDNILDLPGLCGYLHVSDKWVYQRTHLKEIPHLKIKGLLLFRKREIDKWVDGYKMPVLSRGR